MVSKDEKWAKVVRELSTFSLEKQKELCTRYLHDFSQWQALMKARESQDKKGRGYPPPKPSLKRLKYQFDTHSVTYRFKNMSDKYLKLVRQFGLYRHQLAGESGGGKELEIDSKLTEAEKEWGLPQLLREAASGGPLTMHCARVATTRQSCISGTHWCSNQASTCSESVTGRNNAPTGV
jgi:hypothetical protein